MYSDYIPDSLDMLEEYERDRERRHRLYEKQARREELADIESEEERRVGKECKKACLYRL